MSNTASTLNVVLTGLKGGNTGRQTRVVDFTGPLDPFLAQYGDGSVASTPLTPGEMEELAAKDAAAFKAHMASVTANMLAGSSTSEPQQIVNAVCNYLVQEHDFIISDGDPGSDVFYISKGDVRPTRLEIPGDGVAWMVLAAAPFG